MRTSTARRPAARAVLAGIALILAAPGAAEEPEFSVGPLTKVSGRIHPGEAESPFERSPYNLALYRLTGDRWTPEDASHPQYWRTGFLHAEVEPHFAVGPDQELMVGVWMQDPNVGLCTRTSRDGGATWGPRVVVPGVSRASGGPLYVDANDNWLAFAPNGDLHLIALSREFYPWSPETEEWAVLASKSTDGGETWSAPKHLERSFPAERNLADKCTIAADPEDPNRVYGTWSRDVWRSPDANDAHSEIVFARTLDGGETWEVETIYERESGWGGGSEIAVRDGAIAVVFAEYKAWSSRARLMVVRSTDGGETWGPGIVATDMVPREHTSPDHDWGTFDPDNSDDNRGTPDDSLRIWAGEWLPHIASDPTTGRIWAVWLDARWNDTGPLPPIHRVAVSASDDGGLTWTPPVPVNQTPADLPDPGNGQAFLPAIAVAEDGTVGVLYYDFRNDDPGPELWTDVFLATCSPDRDFLDPASWQEVRLTSPDNAYGGRFDMNRAGAVLPRGDRLAHYVALQAAGDDFAAFFTLPGVIEDDDGDGWIDEDPLGLFDDDGDGLLDEDPEDGEDNDGDGAIDEDPPGGGDDDGDGRIDEDGPDPSSVFFVRASRLD